jgi:DnaK suppressor protein
MKKIENYPFSKSQLNAFKSKLMMQREQVQSELQRLEEEALPGLYQDGEANADHGEDAKMDQIRQRMISMVEKHRKHLREVNAALTRIENHTYGLDEKTGQPIRIERLEALPTARVDV